MYPIRDTFGKRASTNALKINETNSEKPLEPAPSPIRSPAALASHTNSHSHTHNNIVHPSASMPIPGTPLHIVHPVSPVFVDPASHPHAPNVQHLHAAHGNKNMAHKKGAVSDEPKIHSNEDLFSKSNAR